MTSQGWIDTWVSTPQPTAPEHLPPSPFSRDDRVFADSTLRQTVRVSVGGRRVRLCLSNTFGASPLLLAKAAVALPAGGQAGVPATQPGSSRSVTFGGRPSVRVPARAQVESDPVDLDVAARSNLTVTIYLPEGHPPPDVTSHPGSRTSSYLVAGDHVADAELPGPVTVDHWYFLSGVRVPARTTSAAAVIVGDSLTDGRGSTTNGNDRWWDRLLDRLHCDPDTADVAVLSHAAGGTRLLDDGQGAGCLDRLARGVLAREALRWLVVFKGVNDIGAAAATRAAQERVAVDLITAYDQIITRMRANGVRVYGATLPPFGGHAGYDDPPGHRDTARQRVNGWIRGSGRFDSLIDVDRAVRDPGDPRRLSPGFDDGDGLHLNPTGYRALGECVPTRLFRLAADGAEVG